VFGSNARNTHMYDENEILLLLLQLYFEAKTASFELFVLYSYSAKYSKVAIRYSPNLQITSSNVIVITVTQYQPVVQLYHMSPQTETDYLPLALPLLTA